MGALDIRVGTKQERDNPSEVVGQQALFDIGYADKITPVLAQPERAVPNGTRVG